MNKFRFQTSNLKSQNTKKSLLILGFLMVLGFSAVNILLQKSSAQTAQILPPTPFRIGEKLTYNFTFDRFKNAGYAETFVVSRGKLNERDVVELSSKIKTSEFVSAAFYLIDETRTTFAATETGLPLYVRKISDASVFPEEKVDNFLDTPTQNFDLLTLIYRIRNAGGNGNFSLQENEKIYSVSASGSIVEKIKTDAGEFDTNVAQIQSEFFTEKGLTDFRINFSTDESHIPVLIRFKVGKAEFRASLASISVIADETNPPTPTPTQTPQIVSTPTPRPTAAPYLENQPLLAELPFVLGETLEYRITSNGQSNGMILFQVKERKELNFNGVKRDSLLFNANISKVSGGFDVFKQGDSITSQVNPESLQPHQLEIKFNGALSGLNQSVIFDQQRGLAFSGGANQVQIPVNTHNLLSLFYAIRSFNLKPSKDLTSPVNDTRVSVFYGDQFYVFLLRPAEAQIITLDGKKVSAQQITIITGNLTLDSLNLRIWLSNERDRKPLRFAVGNYQADLVSQKIIKPN
jgi:hypothetical protein